MPFNRIARNVFFFLAGLAVLAGPAAAENPPTGYRSVRINFKDSTGLFNYYKGQEIPDTAGQSLRNIDFTLNGALTQRRGVERNFFALSVPILGDPAIPVQPQFLDIFFSTTNSRTYFISKLLTRLQYHAYPVIGTNAVNDLAVTGCGNTDGAQVDGVSFQPTNSYYIVTDTTQTCKLTSHISTDATINTIHVSTPPFPAKYLQVHLDHMLVSGVTSDPLRFFWSEEGDADSFLDGDFLDVFGSGKGDEITGLGAPLLGLLPIYTRTTSSVLIGTEFPVDGEGGNVKVRTVSDTIGCIHHHTIRNKNNRQYFFSRGENDSVPGIYSLNGISIREETKRDRRLFLNNVDVSTRIVPFAFVYHENYCLEVATKNSSFLNMMICVDPAGLVTVNDNSIQPLSFGYGVPYQGSMIFTNGVATGNTDAGGVFLKWDSGFRDDTSSTSVSGGSAAPIPFHYKTKDFNFTNPNILKIPDRAYISYDNIPSSSFTVRANFDFGRSSFTWVIVSSKNYVDTDARLRTVAYSSQTVVTRLLFTKDTNYNFNSVNWEVYGSSSASVDYIEMFALDNLYR